jgi:2-dehydropantoate 2-reductase
VPVRYLIIGAGAIGGTIGALLAESGHDVVLVARGAHLDALRSKGLRFVTPRGGQTLQIPAIGGPEEIELRLDDVLMLCVKSQDTAAVLDSWADRAVTSADVGGSAGEGVPTSVVAGSAGELLPVVCAQNGVDNERAALRRFANVYGMSVTLPAGHLAPGIVTAVSEPVVGVLTLGRYPWGTDGVVEQIAADLTASRLEASVDEQVQRWKYGKLLRNLVNAVEAVCGLLNDPVPASDAAQLRTLAMAEGRSVLTAAGIASVSDAEQGQQFERLTMREVAEAPRPGGSSWQSLARGSRTIEASYLNGEIVLLARLHGIAAPVNAMLQRLAEHAAANGIEPGWITPAKILNELGHA